MITLQLRRGKAESIKRFHPWIFSGAIQGTQPRNQHIEEGEIIGEGGEAVPSDVNVGYEPSVEQSKDCQ